MKKKWFFAALTVVSVVVLSLAACGQTDESNDSIADLKGDVARLQSEKISDESYISSLEADSAAKDVRIAELESEIAAAINESESSVEESSDDDSNYDDAVYYDTLEELVAEYRSGEWDGKALRRRRGSDNITAELSSFGYITERKDDGYRIWDTPILCPDLPDGKTPWDYIDSYHDDETAVQFCLEYDGIHRYQCGEEISFWPIDDVTSDSKFCGLYRHGPCVIVGERVSIPDSHGDRIIEYSDDGNLSTIVEGVLVHGMDDSGGIATVSFYDGVIQYWYGTRKDDRIFTVAENATDAACVRYANHIFFTKEDGSTYVVNINTVFEDEDFDAISRHQFQLGQEGVAYYVSEYQKLEDEHWNDSKDSPYYGERDCILLWLLDEHCTSILE